MDDDVIKYGLHLLGDEDEFEDEVEEANLEVSNFAKSDSNPAKVPQFFPGY